MANTPVEAKQQYDSEFLFKQLVTKLKTKPPETEQRIVAHIREATGHTTLPSYHQNGNTEDEKVDMYRRCLKAVLTGNFDELTAPAPERKAAINVESKAQIIEEAPAKPAQPIAITDPKVAAIAAAVAAALSSQPSSGVDVKEVRSIVQEAVGERMKLVEDDLEIRLAQMSMTLGNRIETFLKNIPPRDVVEIRKWDGTVKEIKGAAHRQLGTIVKALAARNAIGWSEFLYLVGAPGAGKTHLLRQIAEALGVKHYPFPCGPTTTEGKMLGYNNIANGQFTPGWLYKPYKDGGLVGLDEIDLADASVLGGCNSIENDEFTFGNGETVKRHPDFYLIAFANTIGTGATGGFVRNKLDAATLNRFTHIRLEYDEDLERRIFGNPKWTDYVIKVRKYVEKNCNQSIYITPRASRKGAALLAQGFTPEQVCEMTLFGLCSKEIKESIINNVGTFKP